MKKRLAAAGALALVVGLAAVAVASATSHRSAKAAASCGTFTIGMSAPITGPAASIGSDQLHWAEFYVSQWNKKKNAPFKLNLKQFDDQLDPSKAATGAQQFSSSKSVLGVIGPAGSDQVIAAAPILKRAGFAFISGSATRVSLTGGQWRGSFFRVVPNDNVQGPSDVAYMTSKLGVASGDSVMVIDDQEAYSTGLADIVQKGLQAKGVKVDRESISQKDTDFSSLVAKVTSSTKVVFTPFQLSSQTQLLAQQLKAQVKKAVVFATDGSFDVAKFNADGNYVSFFAADVTTIPADASVVKAFHKQFPGATSPFGAPNYVAMQVYATALSSLCAKHAKVTRASVRAAVAKVKLKSTLIGPISFTRNGDVAGAKFHIFKITGGKYVTVS
jgi:branched-chain amino acid transport system substrate-binding protein